MFIRIVIPLNDSNRDNLTVVGNHRTKRHHCAAGSHVDFYILFAADLHNTPVLIRASKFIALYIRFLHQIMVHTVLTIDRQTTPLLFDSANLLGHSIAIPQPQSFLIVRTLPDVVVKLCRSGLIRNSNSTTILVNIVEIFDN